MIVLRKALLVNPVLNMLYLRPYISLLVFKVSQPVWIRPELFPLLLKLQLQSLLLPPQLIDSYPLLPDFLPNVLEVLLEDLLLDVWGGGVLFGKCFGTEGRDVRLLVTGLGPLKRGLGPLKRGLGPLKRCLVL